MPKRIVLILNSCDKRNMELMNMDIENSIINIAISILGIIIPIMPSLGSKVVCKYKRQILIPDIYSNFIMELGRRLLCYILDLLHGALPLYILFIIQCIINYAYIMGKEMEDDSRICAVVFGGFLIVAIIRTLKMRNSRINSLLKCVLLAIGVGFFMGVNELQSLYIAAVFIQFVWYWEISNKLNTYYEEGYLWLVVRQFRNVILCTGILYFVCENNARRCFFSDVYRYVSGNQVMFVCDLLCMAVSVIWFYMINWNKEKKLPLKAISYVYTKTGIFAADSMVYLKDDHIVFTCNGTTVYQKESNVICMKYIIRGKKRKKMKKQCWRVQCVVNGQ